MIFFFKQKTAYEMRISDWSSDVCSSDLHADAVLRPGAARGGPLGALLLRARALGLHRPADRRTAADQPAGPRGAERPGAEGPRIALRVQAAARDDDAVRRESTGRCRRR